MLKKQAYIDFQKCDGALDCPARKGCPAGAIFRDGREGPYFIGQECRGCGRCVSLCDLKAISLV